MSVEFQDYYQVLGVQKTASQDEIQKAYRRLAKKYHPDINKEKGAEDKFKKIAEAYAVLKQPESRRRYDTLGSGWKGGEPFTPPKTWQNVGFDFGGGVGGTHSGFSNFFDMFFRDAFTGSSRQEDGEDLEANITVSLLDALEGAQKSFSISGGAKTKQLQVNIPPGATEGSKIRLKGHGGKGENGGRNGDLLLKLHLAPDPNFKVIGHDIHTVVALAPWEAALGAHVEVPLVRGRVKLTIPAGTQSGTTLRLRGKGLPHGKSPPGDALVETKIVVPTTLSAKEKELLETLSKVSSFQPRAT